MARKGNRNNLKPFPKGSSGNPGGRPRRKPITDLLLAALDKKRVGTLELPGGRTLEQVIVEAWVRNVVGGNQRAIADLMDRLEGKVSEDPPADSGSLLVESIRAILERRPATAKPKKRTQRVRKADGGQPPH